MDEINYSEIHSYLNMYCLKLNKELSTMKEKNNYLEQKVKELESNIISIIQHTVTKKEMKEMITEGLSPIINILMGKAKEKEKETTHVQTQTKNVIIGPKKDKIQNLEEILQSNKLDKKIEDEDMLLLLQIGSGICNPYLCSLTETEDKRIASGGSDGNISISS